MLFLISETSSFACLTLQNHLVPFHSLQFPGDFLKGSGYWQCAWEAKLSVTRPQLHPVMQESLGHTKLHQYLTAGLGGFAPGALSSEADNLTFLFIEQYVSSHSCLLLYSLPKSILCSESKMQSGRKKKGRKSQ